MRFSELLSVPGREHRGAWWPGRIAGGVALVAAPFVVAAGLLVRYLAVDHSTSSTEPLAAVAELAAYARDPGLVTTGYGLYLAGAVLMVPAVITLAVVAARRAPRLAVWGGLLTVLGLCGRIYYAGVDQTGFALVDRLGLQEATRVVREAYLDVSYGPLRLPVTAAAVYYLGLALLALATIRSGTFGVPRGLLVFAAGLWMGVLKEAHLHEVVLVALLAVVFAPLGARVLRSPDLRPDVHDGTPGRIRWLW